MTRLLEYRRGVPCIRKDDFWHWQPECPTYPKDTFAIRKDRPLADELCRKCLALSGA